MAPVGLGAVLGDLPAGRVVARFGERRASIAGSLIGTMSVPLSLVAWTPVVLALGACIPRSAPAPGRPESTPVRT